MSSKDSLGDRLKDYENIETGKRFIPMVPIYARLDGRSFSKFTKGLNRPYCVRMSVIMEEVTKYLVKETGALTGYTQSDEISLCWLQDSYYSEVFFAGKVQKMVSTLSALATAKFVQLALERLPDNCASRLPTFDARVFQVSNVTELANCFLWRVQDAVKNSIQMTAQHHFSHKDLQGLNQKDQLEKLESAGVIWGNYPAFFKEGIFVKREHYLKGDAVRSRIVSIEDGFRFKDLSRRENFIISKTYTKEMEDDVQSST